MLTEEELIKGLKEGNHQTYGELYDRYAKNLYLIILKIVKSEEEAENLLQDCFVKIWRSIELYDSSVSRLYTWLIVIARNIAIDFCRSSYFSKKSKIQSDDYLVFKESLNSEMLKLDYLGLDKVVDGLDLVHRKLIELQYYLGYTQQEVSEELQIPLGTVKSRTRTALKILREKLS